MSVDHDDDMRLGEHMTVDDLDIDTDAEIDDTHPFEIGTAAERVVMANTERVQLPEELSIEAAIKLADELTYAADQAAQYQRKKAAEAEAEAEEGDQ